VVASEVVVGVLLEEAVLEAANYVLVGDVGNGVLHLEEALGVGPRSLVELLLNLGQVMTSTCSYHGSLEVVDEGPLEALPGVDEVWLEAFELSEGCRFQDYQEVECLGGVGST
jgi:hypothetical protein